MVSLQRGKAAVIVMGMGGTWHNLRKRDWSHEKKSFNSTIDSYFRLLKGKVDRTWGLLDHVGPKLITHGVYLYIGNAPQWIPRGRDVNSGVERSSQKGSPNTMQREKIHYSQMSVKWAVQIVSTRN